MERLICLFGLATLLLAGNAQAQSPTLASIVDGHSVAGVVSDCQPCDGVVAQPQIGQIVEGWDAAVVSTRERQRRISGGYEFGWLQPRFSENVSVVVSTPAGDRANSFEHPFEVTPRVWVGIENSRCTGVRARFWNLETDAAKQVAFAVAGAAPLSLTISGASGNLSRTAVASVGDAMTSDHHLEMRTIDLEGTRRFRMARTDTLTSFGLRYAKTEQRTHAVATDGTGSLTELVCQDLEFDGFGPTASIETMHGLFPCHQFLNRLALYVDARGSILIGRQRQEIVLVTGGGATLAEDDYEHDDLMPIGELAGGLQLAAQPLGRALWQLRTGYRAETWFGAGGPVDSDSNLGVHGVIFSITANW